VLARKTTLGERGGGGRRGRKKGKKEAFTGDIKRKEGKTINNNNNRITKQNG
jgi:hypothetical protein